MWLLEHKGKKDNWGFKTEWQKGQEIENTKEAWVYRRRFEFNVGHFGFERQI
jgi:hypothetical protein